MPLVQIVEERLMHRGPEVQSLLRCIAKQHSGPAWRPRSTYSRYIIGAFDGTVPSSDYQYWRFATYVPSFQASYYEAWLASGDNTWCLERAYLSLFEISRPLRRETEVLCLHCDPNEPDDAKHVLYKRGPHLHICTAPNPINHAHFALNRGHLDAVLSSVESLSQAMEQALQMIKEEVLEPSREA